MKKKKDIIGYSEVLALFSEMLNRKKAIKLEMIRKAHNGLRITSETLLAV